MDNDELTDNEEKVLKHIEQKPQITAQEISEVLDVSLRHAKRLISGLKDKGFIIREGSDKTGIWTVINK